MHAVGTTAQLTAAVRAGESQRHDGLFHDPFAQLLAGEDGFTLLTDVAAGLPPEAVSTGIAIRTRWIDEQLQGLLHGGTNTQVVLLAAGLDTRAYRLPLPAGTTVYELDQPHVLTRKNHLLAQADAASTANRVAVPVDLAGQWSGRLLEAGFAPEQPSVWVAEGLLVYLGDDDVERLIAQTATLAAPGSRLLADIVGRAVLASPPFATYRARLAAHGAPWRFASDEPEQLLARHGWGATVVRFGEEGAHYGRWSLPPAPRDTPGYPNSYLINAVRQQDV